MQAIVIFAAMILGVLFPQGHQFTFLVRYLVMIMLFYAFLRIRFNWRVLSKLHFLIAGLNVTLPILLYLLFSQINPTIGLAAFTIGMAPTAAGAPVMAGFLRQDVGFVTLSVILTSPIVALVLPLLLPQIIAVDQPISVLDVLIPVAILVFVPLILGQFIRRRFPTWVPYFFKLGNVPFYLFVTNIYIAAGKATHFIRYEAEAPLLLVGGIAACIGLVCFFLFKSGEAAGRYFDKDQEAGLALGRKNTMFGLWVALTFINPLVALGPIFYIVFQNLYNTWQLWLVNKSLKAKKVAQA